MRTSNKELFTNLTLNFTKTFENCRLLIRSTVYSTIGHFRHFDKTLLVFLLVSGFVQINCIDPGRPSADSS